MRCDEKKRQEMKMKKGKTQENINEMRQKRKHDNRDEVRCDKTRKIRSEQNIAEKLRGKPKKQKKREGIKNI